MNPNNMIDFRHEAEVGTRKMLEDADDMNFSGCIRVLPNLQTRKYWEYFFWLSLLVVFIGSAMLAAMGFFVWGNMLIAIPSVVMCSFSMTIWHGIKLQLVRYFLKKRVGSLFADYNHLPWIYVNLEDGNTHRKMKLISEDEGICIFDAGNRRILIEGVVYRYMFCADDINRVEQANIVSPNGTLLNCRVGGSDLFLYMTSFGKGKMPPGVQSVTNTTLCRKITFTLFGATQDAYRKPPAMPGEE